MHCVNKLYFEKKPFRGVLKRTIAKLLFSQAQTLFFGYSGARPFFFFFATVGPLKHKEFDYSK